MIGFYNVLKPTGLTSNDVVGRLKKILNRKDIGHMGTLDPMAAGVLPIAVGKATRLFDYLLHLKKTYIATFLLGVETDTDDSTGTKIKSDGFILNKDNLNIVISKFIGKITQIPPKYSAIKINGKRAYDLARNNIEFEVKPRVVEIFNIEILNIINNYVTFKFEVEGGTYIRTLGKDIATKLGTTATMVSLIRTQSSSFKIENSILIDNVNESTNIINVKDVLHIDTIRLDDISFRKLINGIKLKYSGKVSGEFFVENTNGVLLGIGMLENGFIRIKTNLYEGE